MSDSNPVGRPRIRVDWEQIDDMLKIFCTAEEIAGILSFSVDTLDRRCKEDNGINFAEYSGQKRQHGKASLRRSQYVKATQEGNPTMQIWLGKQYLDQKDQIESKETKEIKIVIDREDEDL